MADTHKKYTTKLIANVKDDTCDEELNKDIGNKTLKHIIPVRNYSMLFIFEEDVVEDRKDANESTAKTDNKK